MDNETIKIKRFKNIKDKYKPLYKTNKNETFQKGRKYA